MLNFHMHTIQEHARFRRNQIRELIKPGFESPVHLSTYQVHDFSKILFYSEPLISSSIKLQQPSQKPSQW